MMYAVKQINILDMLDMYGEDSCREILSTFICSLNIDVADFIHNKAIEFAKQRIAITFLVFRETEKGNVSTGYYTLANKFVAVSANVLPIQNFTSSMPCMILCHLGSVKGKMMN